MNENEIREWLNRHNMRPSDLGYDLSLYVGADADEMEEFAREAVHGSMA